MRTRARIADESDTDNDEKDPRIDLILNTIVAVGPTTRVKTGLEVTMLERVDAMRLEAQSSMPSQG